MSRDFDARKNSIVKLTAGMDIVTRVRAHAAEVGDRTALTGLDERGGESIVLTYGQLDRRARATAVFLAAHVRPGDRVLLAFHDPVEFAVAFFGCAYAGAVAVPVPVPMSGKNDKGRFSRIAGIVTECRPVIGLSTRKVVEEIWPFAEANGVALRCLPIEIVEESRADEWEERTPELDALAFLQYTSGSTGAPRGVRISHRNLTANVQQLGEFTGYDTSKPFVSWLPHYHDMGLVLLILFPLYNAAPVYLMSPAAFLKRPVRWLEAISRYRAGSSGAPNFAYELCVRRIPPEARAALDLTCLTSAGIGAEPISAATLERFSDAFAASGFARSALRPGYGLAETVVFMTVHRSPQGFRMLELPGGTRAVSCGKPPSDSSLRIVDPVTRVPVEDGMPGEIVFASPSVSDGYWGGPMERCTLTDPADGTRSYFATGDVGVLVDGELAVVGRLKDIVIVNGTNYHAPDIEETAAREVRGAIPSGCAAFGAQVEGKEQLIVAIEIERYEPGREAELLGTLRLAVIEQHEVNLHDLVVLRPGRLPRTSSGKIRRHLCREQYERGELR
jgi:acyl-CoA synthetase (AMP-forming)/AMP-acid ligase II